MAFLLVLVVFTFVSAERGGGAHAAVRLWFAWWVCFLACSVRSCCVWRWIGGAKDTARYHRN